MSDFISVGRGRSLSERRTDARKRGAARAANNDTDDRYREAEGEGLGLGSPRATEISVPRN